LQLTMLSLQNFMHPVEKFQVITWHLIKSAFDDIVWGFSRYNHYIIIYQTAEYRN
jgi:hypothetical protein